MDADYKDRPVIKKVSESIQVSAVDVINMSMISLLLKGGFMMPSCFSQEVTRFVLLSLSTAGAIRDRAFRDGQHRRKAVGIAGV